MADETAAGREKQAKAHRRKKGLELLRCVQERNALGVKALIDSGAPLEEKDDKGRTAAMWACNRGDEECLRALIDAGARLKGREADRWSALDLAVGGGHVGCAEMLLSARQKGRSPVDVDAADHLGHTALMVAIGSEEEECVRALIRRGADLELRDDEGETALFWASGSCGGDPFSEGLKALVAAGAAVDGVGREGRTAAMVAARKGSLECLEILLSAGADLWSVAPDGASARSIAEAKDHDEVVEWLDAMALSIVEREALGHAARDAEPAGGASKERPKASLRM